VAALTKEPRLRRNDTSKGFPHSCKPELRHKAAIMGSGPGEVWSGPDETVEIRRRRQGATQGTLR